MGHKGTPPQACLSCGSKAAYTLSKATPTNGLLEDTHYFSCKNNCGSEPVAANTRFNARLRWEQQNEPIEVSKAKARRQASVRSNP